VGDCNGKGGFTHTSWNDAESLEQIFWQRSAAVSDRITAYALYIDPPLGARE